MKIEMIDRNKIKLYSKNAKRHPESQVQKIARSIQEFGWQIPVLISETDEIIAGHGRVLAADLLNIKQIPCLRATGLTPNQVKAFRLADNKVSESDFDLVAVVTELSDLDLSGFDFTVTGFDEIPELLTNKIKPISIKPPPTMAWVLLGIPIHRYGQVQDAIEKISTIDGVICETGVGDENENR